jgi:formylmethanofuran dehydrogenase subunit E
MDEADFLARGIRFAPRIDMTQSSEKRCAMCGKPISAARLEALPGVTTCIDCAKKYPRKVDTSGVELSQASPINRNGFAPRD